MTLPIPLTPVQGSQLSSSSFGGPVATDLQALAPIPLGYFPRQILGASAPSVSFTVPSQLRSLRLKWTARGDAVVQTQLVFLRINGDTGTNYNSEYLQGNNATVTASPVTGVTGGVAGNVVGASAPGGAFATGDIDIVGWDSPHSGYLGWTFKAVALGTGVANFIVMTGGGQYTPAGPYTSVTLFPNSGNFVIGSDFQLEAVNT